jgi:nucleotide-binding universal stress UspA family protein
MILVSYEGSVDAQAAVDHAARLMPGAEATVLTVWEPFTNVMMGAGSMGMGLGTVRTSVDSEVIDKASREAALANATEGAERARAAGLVARARPEPRQGDVANTILVVAAEVDADVIVMGTRGLGAVKSFLLGSVSHAVIQRADRAVLIVPSPALAEQRADGIEHGSTPA